MADRGHIRFDGQDWIVQKKYNGEKGGYRLEDGTTRASPVIIGDIYGNDRIVAINSVTNDTSTTDMTVSTTTETVDETQILRTTDIRDMTAEEIDDAETLTAASEWVRLQNDPNLWVQLDWMWQMQNEINVIAGNPTILKTEYNQDYRDSLRARINQMVGGQLPAANAKPTIDGALEIGVELTGQRGSWSGLKPIDYDWQWFRLEADGKFKKISGANKRRYTPVADDVGKALRLRVTGTNELGSFSIRSRPIEWP